MKKRLFRALTLLISICILFTSCSTAIPSEKPVESTACRTSLNEIPEYSGKPYVALENNIPSFTDEEKSTTGSFEKCGELDKLGRCTTAFACCGIDIMPTKKRESISEVKPTGWHSVRYSGVEGGSLYNRCHLLAFELTGENANEQNLITGTRYMNATGMLPFENMIADYIKETKNHVMYRVTPIFDGENLIASGVQMEAWSVEDNGDGICFNIYCYNVQPGIVIDYETGESHLSPEDKTEITTITSTTISKSQTTTSYSTQSTYILNENSKKFHLPDCDSVKKMKAENRKEYHGNRKNLINEGYKPCGSCKP
ncbi:MAG: DNA/RNA non-specific endonuclease [Ruminococcus sp.]|nr:DNA/RNA non-specific endonuclease [Candidatus Copronaster equi]